MLGTGDSKGPWNPGGGCIGNPRPPTGPPNPGGIGIMPGAGLKPGMGGNRGSRCMALPNPGGIWGRPGGKDIAAAPMGAMPNGPCCGGIDLMGNPMGDAECDGGWAAPCELVPVAPDLLGGPIGPGLECTGVRG